MKETQDEILTFERVTRRFGAHVALLDASLNLKPGLIGLLGPNGAGKTTLLRLAAGLIRPTTGRVSWLGGHRRHHPALDNQIAMSSDGDALPVRESPRHFLTMLLRCAGLNATAAIERATETLTRLGLSEKLDVPIATLSRGQRQRVKLAQALALPTSLLLLDEPMSALDPVWRMEVATMMRQAAASGTCVVVSSHILEEVEALADTLVLLFQGRVIGLGSQQEIQELMQRRGTALRVRSDHPRKIAQELLGRSEITALRIEEDELVLEGPDLQTICRALPPSVVASEASVTEVETEGDDLTSLFKALSEEVR